MKKLTTLLMTLMLMSTALWAEETITVSANSSDISEGLDLKVVAKLFAEAKNLEEFETMLNNPDSAFCNLDLNGDGQVDYLRVVETGEGNKRLIVLQAILAKDIYQDVASIYVEKDEKNEVSVQIIGDEYVYGTNYIIEPVYVYRPVIYDWFWSPVWVAWNSPWYWGYYPGWWYVHSCWAHDWYWNRCYAWHHHHHWCSFRPGHAIRHGYYDLYRPVSRREYATIHPDRSFDRRNTGMTNAREIRSASHVQPTRSAAARGEAARSASASASRGAAATTSRGEVSRSASAASRTYGSSHTAVARSASVGNTSRTTTPSRASSAGTTATATRSTSATTTRGASSSATRSTNVATSRTTTPSRTSSVSRTSSSSSATTTRSTSTTASRSTSPSKSTSYTPSRTSTYTPSRTSSSSSSSSSRSGGSTYSGGSRGGSSSGGYSGGSRGGGGGGGSRGGGGSPRR